MKVAPLYKVLQRQSWCSPHLVFLSQHHDPVMSTDIFEEFGLSGCYEHVDIADLDYGERLGQIIQKFMNVLERISPNLLVVPGDVDTSAAATLAGKRMQIPVAHLEAGLRSHDEAMPEEINRKLIDCLSDILLAPSEAAAEHLVHQEGCSPKDVHFVGNIMIDALQDVLEPSREPLQARTARRFGYDEYALVTLHRPSNVDSGKRLAALCGILARLSRHVPIIFPVHPRTASRLKSAPKAGEMLGSGQIGLCDPLSYGEFLSLMAGARYVMTDSGGIQEEAAYLGVPCFTLRETTERPITVQVGGNTLVSPHDVEARIENFFRSNYRPARPNIPLWDGQTSWRVAHVLRNWWERRRLAVVAP